MFLASYQNIFSIESLSFIKAFIFAIGGISFITFFHELGHYVFARLFNVKVAAFSIGFGHVSWFPTFKDKNGTVWKFGPIPFGGYVGILSEPVEDEVIMEDMGVVNFEQKVKEQDVSEIKGIYLRDCTELQTILISFAGPLFNLILSFAIVFLIVFKFGRPILIAKYNRDTTHFLQNDVIARINKTEPYNSYHFSYLSKQDKPSLTIIRNGYRIVEISIASIDELKLVDLKQSILFDEKKDFFGSASFSLGFVKLMSQISIQNYAQLPFMFAAKEKPKVSGPIGIIRSVIETARKNEVALFLHQMALISILIGIFNLIPIPPLDGGHILFTLIKMVFGESVFIQNLFNKIGLFVAVGLIGLTTIADLKAPATKIVGFFWKKTGFSDENIAHADHRHCKTCSKNTRL